MPNFAIYPTDTNCLDACSFLGEVCFTREDCTPTCTDFIWSKCGDQYNCNLGQCDKPYFNPYIEGDTIQFQTKFVDDYNADESNPVDGWGTFVTAEVCDADGNIIATHDNAIKSIAAWNGTESYQIIEFDTTGFPVCFEVNIKSFNQTGLNDQLCSQSFKRVECDEPTFVIESEFPCSDCCDNYYGDPVAFVGDNFNYSNKWRFWGRIVETGLSFEKTLVGTTKRTGTNITDVFTISDTGCLVPAYVMRMLYKQHFASQHFYIDGVEYFLDSANISNVEGSSMFQIAPQLTRECNIKFNCDC